MLQDGQRYKPAAFYSFIHRLDRWRAGGVVVVAVVVVVVVVVGEGAGREVGIITLNATLSTSVHPAIRWSRNS